VETDTYSIPTIFLGGPMVVGPQKRQDKDLALQNPQMA